MIVNCDLIKKDRQTREERALDKFKHFSLDDRMFSKKCFPISRSAINWKVALSVSRLL